MKHEARFWNPTKAQYVQCHLCAHSCRIPPKKRGICGVRENDAGTLYALTYGRCTSPAVDPIEKKPFFHFHPGTFALSLGSVGCNFSCEHCQNYTSSTGTPDAHFIQEVSPEEAVQLAQQNHCQGIAFTYNEPTIWHEYCFDTARLARKDKLYTAYVTNGYIAEEPLREIAPVLDAMNIDVKAFSNDFYQRICHATLEPVLQTCVLAHNLGIHIELTYLVIPGLNDAPAEIRAFCEWVITELDKNIPLHFTRFHPAHHMTDRPATPLETLENVYAIAQEAGIQFPYLGNVPTGDYEHTLCPHCGSLVIERHSFSATIHEFCNGTCPKCGTPLPIIQ